MKPTTLWIGAALLAVIAAGAGATFLTSPGEGPREGTETTAASMAPDFALPAAQGTGTVTLSEYKGKVVLVNFWATWCPPCRAEIPDFIRVRESLHPQGFEIIGVALDEGGAKDVVPFAKEYGISYPLAIGDSAVTQRYGGIRGIPTSFLVDREGRIAQKYTGAIDAQTLDYAVRSLL